MKQFVRRVDLTFWSLWRMKLVLLYGKQHSVRELLSEERLHQCETQWVCPAGGALTLTTDMKLLLRSCCIYLNGFDMWTLNSLKVVYIKLNIAWWRLIFQPHHSLPQKGWRIFNLSSLICYELHQSVFDEIFQMMMSILLWHTMYKYKLIFKVDNIYSN